VVVKPETYGEAEYIADNYGSCALEKCPCLAPRVPWLGRGCPHWQPAQAATFDELRSRAYVKSGRSNG
jgi:hypothetical protein